MQDQTIKLNVRDHQFYKEFFEGKGEHDRVLTATRLIELTNRAFAHYPTFSSFDKRPNNKRIAVALVNESVMAINTLFITNTDSPVDRWGEIDIPGTVYYCIDRVEEITEPISIITEVFTCYLTGEHGDDRNLDEEDMDCLLLMEFFTYVFIMLLLKNPSFIAEQYIALGIDKSNISGEAQSEVIERGNVSIVSAEEENTAENV